VRASPSPHGQELSTCRAAILVVAISARGYTSFNYRDRNLNAVSPSQHFSRYNLHAAGPPEICAPKQPQIARTARPKTENFQE
jgi:hypothetical protein